VKRNCGVKECAKLQYSEMMKNYCEECCAIICRSKAPPLLDSRGGGISLLPVGFGPIVPVYE
jgi:hypothetical protein